MTQVIAGSRERVSRVQRRRFAHRRDQLASSALQTLAELGYARTSLRDIADHSEFSHGVLHYYFTDKIDLITAAVRMFKQDCVHRYDDIVDNATSADELRVEFAAAMARTLRTEAPEHRLWYDIRNQSLFEGAFRDDVLELDAGIEAMIWRVVSRHAELDGVSVHVERPVAYAMFDGLFHQSLLRFVSGDEGAVGDLEDRACALLETTTA
ncbi:TetR family transcriptional regulator [Nakamurella sp. YIM 132087]|uniref:TetR family transcriptional regulator n=1 Tax=Nakamurella alba TaxID=2665158 RepID=A0A7K1FS53_9ACTN|nr:TetR/AcrR family transcriptional regulator [Nakamurella alba]MTD15654.1 TetR family transcriptional regulator [Nakamurella alba]